MFEILLCSYFGLDHTSSFEIIHTRIDDRQFVILFLCTITDITRTKILSKFQIISKLRMSIRTSWNRIRRLRRTDHWSSLEYHEWNAVKDFVILIVIFSILVE